MNSFNSCKFAASFPDVLIDKLYPALLQKFWEKKCCWLSASVYCSLYCWELSLIFIQRSLHLASHAFCKYQALLPNCSLSPAKAGGRPLPPPPDPGVGGLFSRLFTLVLYSSSLSVLGSCIQKKNLRVDDLNFRINTLPVVHCFTRLYSMSSGKMMRSWK